MTQNDLTIQEKTAQLDRIVEWFDSDDFTLELALEKFKQAEEIATDIQADLAGLKNDIQVVKQRFDKDGV